MKKTLLERFEEKIFFGSPDGCWYWTASSTISSTNDSSFRYGNFGYQGKNILAHRMSYILYKKIDPADKCVLHSCDNPLCVNPDHLWLGTNKDNSIDMVLKKRNAKTDGENNGNARLSKEQISLIRKSKDTKRNIAAKYGIHFSYVCKIGSGSV